MERMAAKHRRALYRMLPKPEHPIERIPATLNHKYSMKLEHRIKIIAKAHQEGIARTAFMKSLTVVTPGIIRESKKVFWRGYSLRVKP